MAASSQTISAGTFPHTKHAYTKTEFEAAVQHLAELGGFKADIKSVRAESGAFQLQAKCAEDGCGWRIRAQEDLSGKRGERKYIVAKLKLKHLHGKTPSKPATDPALLQTKPKSVLAQPLPPSAASSSPKKPFASPALPAAAHEVAALLGHDLPASIDARSYAVQLRQLGLSNLQAIEDLTSKEVEQVLRAGKLLADFRDVCVLQVLQERARRREEEQTWMREEVDLGQGLRNLGFDEQVYQGLHSAGFEITRHLLEASEEALIELVERRFGRKWTVVDRVKLLSRVGIWQRAADIDRMEE